MLVIVKFYLFVVKDHEVAIIVS